MKGCANLPLTQRNSPLIPLTYRSRATERNTSPPREPSDIWQPSEQKLHVVIVCASSHGRVWWREVASSNVPVGQTSIQLPPCEQSSQPRYVPITACAPRPPASIA